MIATELPTHWLLIGGLIGLNIGMLFAAWAKGRRKRQWNRLSHEDRAALSALCPKLDPYYEERKR